nr:autotransporter outer membrane beta-barrel domain-containing protein [Brucella pituitosa]
MLTVASNYTGNGGTLVLNTVLGDDSSKNRHSEGWRRHIR